MMQHDFLFRPIYKTSTTFSSLPYSISEQEFKGLSHETFTSPYTTNKSLSPQLIWNKSRIRLKFEETCFKQKDKSPFTPKMWYIYLLSMNEIPDHVI